MHADLLPLKPISPDAILADVQKAMSHTQACWPDQRRKWWEHWEAKVPQNLEAVRLMADDHYGEGVTVSKIPAWEWPQPRLEIDTNPQPQAPPQSVLPTAEPVTYDNSFRHQGQEPTSEPNLVATTTPTTLSTSFTSSDRARAARSSERIEDENRTMELTVGDFLIVTQAPDTVATASGEHVVNVVAVAMVFSLTLL